MPAGSTDVHTPQGDTFEWCGGRYSRADLQCALQHLHMPRTGSVALQQQHHNNVNATHLQIRSAPSQLYYDDANQLSLSNSNPPSPSSSDSSCQLLPQQQSSQCQPLQERKCVPFDLGHTMKPAESSDNPWSPSTWAVLSKDAQDLLHRLQRAEAVPWVSDAMLE